MAFAAVVALAVFAGCDHSGGAGADITEAYQKRLDEKEKELASLRASESALRAQVAEVQGRLAQAESGAGTASRASAAPAVDVAALARELAPLLNASRPEPARMAEAPVAPAPEGAPAPRAGAEGFGLSDPVVRSRGDGPPRGRGPGEVREVGGSGGGSGARRSESFEPVGR